MDIQPHARLLRCLVICPLSTLAILGLLGLTTAQAKPKTAVEQLAGQVILSSKLFPPDFASEQAFLNTMRQMKTTIFHQERGSWRIQFMAFFLVPLEELMCEVHLFDVTYKERDGKARHVETFTQFLPKRGQQTLASTLVLDPERFEKDHHYRMIVARRTDRALLAEARFQLAGPK